VPWNDETRAQYEHIRAEWQAMQQQWGKAPPAASTAAAVARGDAFVGEIDNFVQAIEQRIMRWTAILHLFHLFLVALAIGAAVAFVALSYLLVLNPVTQLQQALARVRQGDLGTRLEVESTTSSASWRPAST
jgi:two-component system nitrate/nitrite sensor histidine kinase NarX